MNRLLMAAALIVLAACGGVSTQNGNGTDKEGLNGKVHKVQTLIYNAKSQGNETVKDGKPDSYRETDFFPKEDTRIYNAAGQARFCGECSGRRQIHYGLCLSGRECQ